MMRKNLHLLSRVSFGPSSASLEQVRSWGREAWLERQLHPEQIDNSELQLRLDKLPTLKMTATELLQNYPRPLPGEKPVPGKEFWRPFVEMSGAKLLMSRYSQAQLLEVMVSFWFNHFNVYGPENLNFYALTPYVMRVIRKHALGTFPELVLATAQSPAMLYYLDNYLSSREISLENLPDRGLNENYARELMELFTVGVEAGYTLKDIQNAAKVLTGWSITRPRTGVLEYRFYPELHERGNKRVFGKTFRSNGEQEGIELLRYLSLRPETALHISHKLVSLWWRMNLP